MIRILHTAIIPLMLLLGLSLSLAQSALASEVTGTLSSDGSSNTEQRVEAKATPAGTVVQNTSAGAGEGAEGQLQGSVVNGREAGGEARVLGATDEQTTTMFALWLLPIIALGALGYFLFFWRKGSV